MISGVIVTLNEVNKLEKCLLSIKNFVDEIIVVDLGSKDETLEVAKKFNAKIYFHEKVLYVELIREFAISKATGEWILVMDPDEQISEGLAARLNNIIEDDKYQIINIPRKNIFFGKWISHTNFWPDRQIRFFKKDSISWPSRIHAYPATHGEILNLSADKEVALLHFGYDSFRDFFQRQKRYSTVEAENRLKEGKKFSVLSLFWQPAREFLVRFIKHKGFLDGIYGIFLVSALMYYQIMVEIKMWKFRKNT